MKHIYGETPAWLRWFKRIGIAVLILTLVFVAAGHFYITKQVRWLAGESFSGLPTQDLQQLEDAGLVDYTKDGLWVNYFLANGDRSPYVSGILDKFNHWLEDDPKVAEIIRKLPTIRREEILNR